MKIFWILLWTVSGIQMNYCHNTCDDANMRYLVFTSSNEISEALDNLNSYEKKSAMIFNGNEYEIHNFYEIKSSSK